MRATACGVALPRATLPLPAPDARSYQRRLKIICQRHAAFHACAPRRWYGVGAPFFRHAAFVMPVAIVREMARHKADEASAAARARDAMRESYHTQKASRQWVVEKRIKQRRCANSSQRRYGVMPW